MAINNCVNTDIELIVDGKKIDIHTAKNDCTPRPVQLSKNWHGLPIEFHSSSTSNRESGPICFPNLLIWYQKTGYTRSKLEAAGSIHYSFV